MLGSLAIVSEKIVRAFGLEEIESQIRERFQFAMDEAGVESFTVSRSFKEDIIIEGVKTPLRHFEFLATEKGTE
jgi:hypothetical protein|tara:strand:+ start:270 stop:491 length:222 start_codon:yes stop_codon:yes gene_type:complete